ARPATELWRGFPSARLVLPRLLLTRRGDACWLTVSQMVGADTDVETAAGEIERELAALRAGDEPDRGGRAVGRGGAARADVGAARTEGADVSRGAADVIPSAARNLDRRDSRPAHRDSVAAAPAEIPRSLALPRNDNRGATADDARATADDARATAAVDLIP